MGNFFSQNTHTNTRHYASSSNELKKIHICEIRNEDIKEIIQQYEHIKTTKHIEDPDKLIAIMKNTNWDTTNTIIQPSAPPLHIEIPIAIAHVIETIETNELIK